MVSPILLLLYCEVKKEKVGNFLVTVIFCYNQLAPWRVHSIVNMMSSAITQKTKATRSAAGGAGGLFLCFDFHSRFEDLTEVHIRMVGAGATLNKAVRSALREIAHVDGMHNGYRM